MKKIIILSILFVLAVLPTGASAAVSLTITSFKCNDKTSLAVENGANINCAVRIQNNDGSNAATVGTIALVVSGGWAENPTYSMAINTNIAAGQSIERTFEGIKPVTTGSNLEFTSVEIDGTPHTEEVTSVAINSMTIKTLSLTTSVSSTATGNEFDAYSSVMVGGNFNSMTLTLFLSGCTLKSGESAAKSLGSMVHNAQESTSWKVVQGSSSTCSLTVSASGTTDTVALSKTASTSVTNPNPSGGDGGTTGGGGGGGANATNVTNVTKATTVSKGAEGAAAPSAGEQKGEGLVSPLGAFFGPVADYSLYLAVLVIIVVIIIIAVKRKQK